MKLPPIKEYISVADYFKDVYEINKKNKKTFSHRFFAKKTGWPISYLSDLIKGRKRLTISRSLQFVQAFKLSPHETEYLLTLCLAHFEDRDVSSYFNRELQAKCLLKEKRQSFKNYLSLFDNIRAMYLRELILWGQGRVSIQKLVEAQIPFPELKKSSALNETLNFLLERKMIQEVKSGYYTVNENGVFALDDDEFTLSNPQSLAKHYIAQLDVLSRLYKSYNGRGFAFSGYIDITVDRYPEVQKKLFDLRDWLISLSKEPKSKDLDKNDTFHLEMHFLPLFNLKKIIP